MYKHIIPIHTCILGASTTSGECCNLLYWVVKCQKQSRHPHRPGKPAQGFSLQGSTGFGVRLHYVFGATRSRVLASGSLGV